VTEPVPTQAETVEQDVRLPGVIITDLASLPEAALLDEEALANMLQVTRRTVRRMVARFELPPPIRLANRSTWRAGTILSWIERRIAAEAEKAARLGAKLGRIHLMIPGDEQQ